MKRKLAGLLIAASIAGIAIAYRMIPPTPTTLVAYVGMRFDEVVKRSSYPTLAHAISPSDDTGFGAIYVSKPAVIIRYDDPRHGFELPPTKFAVLTFGHAILESISTSPMLEPLPFAETVDLLAQLQERFQAAGWTPWKVNGSVWFDLSPEGRKALAAELWRYSQSEQWLVVSDPHAGMIFRIKCVKECDDDMTGARYLIDVGIGDAVGKLKNPSAYAGAVRQ